MFSLSGRVALVSGATGGIGAVVSRALAEHGAQLFLGYHSNVSAADDLAAEIREKGSSVRTAQLDVRDPQSVRGWVARAIDEFQRVDIIAACHGWRGRWQLFTEQPAEAWPEIVEVYLYGALFLCQAVLPQMLQQERGRIVILTSDGAKAGETGLCVANGAQGGVHAFVRALARETARHGITANAVSPGPIAGSAFDQFLTDSTIGHRLADALVKAVPMKRLGTPEEVAAAFVFLASDEASFITGQAISVSGGLTMQ